MRRTLPDGHVRNDAFDSIFPLVFVLAVQVSSKLEVLAYVWSKVIDRGYSASACALATVTKDDDEYPDLSSGLPLQIHS